MKTSAGTPRPQILRIAFTFQPSTLLRLKKTASDKVRQGREGWICCLRRLNSVMVHVANGPKAHKQYCTGGVVAVDGRQERWGMIERHLSSYRRRDIRNDRQLVVVAHSI